MYSRDEILECIDDLLEGFHLDADLYSVLDPVINKICNVIDDPKSPSGIVSNINYHLREIMSENMHRLVSEYSNNFRTSLYDLNLSLQGTFRVFDGKMVTITDQYDLLTITATIQCIIRLIMFLTIQEMLTDEERGKISMSDILSVIHKHEELYDLIMR